MDQGLADRIEEVLAVDAEAYLAPLRYRVGERVTPASWKVDGVRSRLGDGETFADAVTATQREYVHQQSETLLEGTFADWD